MISEPGFPGVESTLCVSSVFVVSSKTQKSVNGINLLLRNKLTLFDVFGLISDEFRNPSSAETSHSHDLFLDT